MIAPHLTERPSKTWVQPLFEVGPDQNMWPGGGLPWIWITTPWICLESCYAVQNIELNRAMSYTFTYRRRMYTRDTECGSLFSFFETSYVSRAILG